MAAGSTYTPIATYTASGTPTSYTFTSIPGTYTDLIIIVDGYMATGSGAYIAVQFNGDTGSNYSTTDLSGNGSTAQSARFTSQTSGIIGAFYSSQANIICSIQNYANSTTYKTAISRSNASSNNTRADVNLWRSTSAITSVKVLAQSDTIANGTTMTLYGITAA
jgi:hypothetical protein